jgi:FkbM family methyltransferase
MPVSDSAGARLEDSFRAQHGEDRILARIFAGVPDGTCIEVGAYDGVELSNSYYFEQLGWRCILVEPNPAMWAPIRQTRRAILFECAASNHESQAILHVRVGDELSSAMDGSGVVAGVKYQDVPIRIRRLDDMLEECRVEHLDFVSIDVEGHELEVLGGFDLNRWKPRIVLLEDNSNLQDTSIPRYMASRRYTRFFRTGVNDWYAAPGTLSIATFRSLVPYGMVGVGKGLTKAWLPRTARGLRAVRLSVRSLLQKSPQG